MRKTLVVIVALAAFAIPISAQNVEEIIGRYIKPSAVWRRSRPSARGAEAVTSSAAAASKRSSCKRTSAAIPYVKSSHCKA
jgi:hypothetical protein